MIRTQISKREVLTETLRVLERFGNTMQETADSLGRAMENVSELARELERIDANEGGARCTSGPE